MTAEQIAAANLRISELQLWVTAIAIFLGPTTGVLITFWMQSRKEKKDMMLKLFVTLMAHRKTNPPSQELVKSLNIIDVVFSKYPQVVLLWHQYYDLTSHRPLNEHLMEAKYLDLVSAMSKAVGYSSLSQTAIARFYTPEIYADLDQLSLQTQLEWLRVLKSTGSFVTLPKEEKKTLPENEED